MERTHKEMKNPSRFTFDGAAEHVYTLLLKKDCYPRFIRSEHYKNLLANGVQPSARRRYAIYQICNCIICSSTPQYLLITTKTYMFSDQKTILSKLPLINSFILSLVFCNLQFSEFN